jgi:GNAT superfamily N-acetyltransferase
MTIAKATYEDIPKLCELLLILFSQEKEFKANKNLQSVGLRKIIDSPDFGQILVIKKNGSIIGMINLLFTISTALGGRVAFLEDVIVHPDHRGLGAGSVLIQEAINFAKESGCHRITVLTDESNILAKKIYKKKGFYESTMVPLRYTL